jgi:nitrogen regulatory protein P-II 1
MNDLQSFIASREAFGRSILMVTAIIEPGHFDSVWQELERSGIYGMTVSEVLGKGGQRGSEQSYRGVKFTSALHHKLKIEIAVEEELVEHVIAAILRSGRSGEGGQIGDGKIFVTRVEEVVRIRTGQTNEAAL